MQLVHDFLVETARRTPHRLAIVDDEGTMTFRELDDAVNAVANRMVEMGVQGGNGVATLAEMELLAPT